MLANSTVSSNNTFTYSCDALPASRNNFNQNLLSFADFNAYV